MAGYLTKQECIAVAGVGDLQIRSLLDRQQYDDPVGDAERMGISSAAWPMFGLLWPSGAQLAALLARHPVLAGERILEIGCGLALASLVAHRRGADVTASDCHPLAAGFLARNLGLNRLSPMAYRHGHWRDPQTVAPRQGAPVQRDVSGRYDLVIGSDVLYERDPQGRLAAFIDRHASTAAQVWIVDPDRGNRPAFTRHMGRAGFHLMEQRLDGPVDGPVAAYKGRLLTYRRGD